MSARSDNLVVGLDVGTTKICAIVGNMTEDGLEIIGVGQSPSYGLRKGVVINIENTVASIKRAIEEAELMAGCEIKSAHVGIAGSHIKSFNSHGIIAIRNKEGVSKDDVQRVVGAAKAIAIPQDREIIHLIPQGFTIDGQEGIKDPVGMSGTRLETEVHIVTAAVSSAQNIVKSCNKAGLDVADVVLEQIASSESVLTADERELGVCMIDIGGGTTDVAVFVNGSIKYTSTLPLGGTHLTNDISVGLRTPSSEANKLKHRYGSCLTANVESDDMIDVPGVGGRKSYQIPRQRLAEILELRVEEIFNLVKAELVKFNCIDEISSGIVLTGGSTILDGMPELAEQVFDLPVRRGAPRNIGGLAEAVSSPIYATGVGLLLFGAKNSEAGNINHLSGSKEDAEGSIGFVKIFKKMKSWFSDFF